MNPSENESLELSYSIHDYITIRNDHRDIQKLSFATQACNHNNNRKRIMEDGDGRDRDEESLEDKKGAPKSEAMTPLGEHFQPGEHDVICGRGRSIYNSTGNRNFRQLVESRVDEYSAAKTKLDKSAILSAIVADVRQLAPQGGFIRKDNKTGQWFEVGDFLAREKVSQSFRDALSDRYKSSNKTKRKRRIEEQAKTAEISSEMQRVALEQMESGRTGKNLWEIICQQQSLLEHSRRQSPNSAEEATSEMNSASLLSSSARPETATSQGGPTISGSSITDYVGQEASTLNYAALPFPPMATAPSPNQALDNMLNSHQWDNTGQLSHQRLSFNQGPTANAGVNAPASAAPTPSAFAGTSGVTSGAALGHTTSPSNFARSLASDLRRTVQTNRTDDPFEPVPLPEGHDLDDHDIDQIFD